MITKPVMPTTIPASYLQSLITVADNGAAVYNWTQKRPTYALGWYWFYKPANSWSDEGYCVIQVRLCRLTRQLVFLNGNREIPRRKLGKGWWLALPNPDPFNPKAIKGVTNDASKAETATEN